MNTKTLLRRIMRLVSDYLYTVDLDNIALTSSRKYPDNVFYLRDNQTGKTFSVTVKEIKEGSVK